jgi:hypothetical protein
MSESARVERVKAALERHDPEVDGTERLPWHDDFRIFPVVELELDAIVLNPDSHRIQAQLESHPEAELVRRDPFSDASQEIIADLLREVEGFEALRDNLAEEKQHNAGVVTPSGVLVNANRRAVALRDNGSKWIRVAVLPEASEIEISDLELRLQMQRDFREKYSFTNRLLFVEELINVQGRGSQEVARALNEASSNNPAELEKGKAKVDQDTRVLALIREVQRRSDERIPLTHFDAQEIAFEELDNKLQDAGDSEAEAAAILELRLLGILTDVPYRDLRSFDAQSLEDHVIPWLEEDDLFGEVLEALPSDPSRDQEGEEPEGLDILDSGPTEEEGRSTQKVRSLVDLFAASSGEEEVGLPTPDGGRTVDRVSAVKALNQTLRDAADDIDSERRHTRRVERPRDRAVEAERKLRLASEAYGRVKDEPDFEPGPFREALDSVRERLDSIIASLDES